jgi:dsRNA-specific ribonuclease
MNAESGQLPYNTKNRLIDQSDVLSLLEYGNICIINNINIYRRAFVHKSYCTRKNENYLDGNLKCPDECMPLQEESNERLEFLGDSILNLIVASYLFERYPGVNEGFLTTMRTKLVNGKMLAFLSGQINLGNFVIMSQQIEGNDGRKNKNILKIHSRRSLPRYIWISTKSRYITIRRGFIAQKNGLCPLLRNMLILQN